MVLTIKSDVVFSSHSCYIAKICITCGTRYRPLPVAIQPRSAEERLSIPMPKGRVMPAVSLNLGKCEQNPASADNMGGFLADIDSDGIGHRHQLPADLPIIATSVRWRRR